MAKRILRLLVVVCALSGAASAQNTEIKITLGEQFFDALLEAVFTHLEEPSVPISGTNGSYSGCTETIRLKREMEGVKTAVRFRQGIIYAPIAFEGSYNLPLVGCIDFDGWAETNIDLRFNQAGNSIDGRARVIKVNLTGTNGVGSAFLARFVQSSIDKKINPLEIISLDKLSFTTPVQNAGKLRMRATGFDHKVNEKYLEIIIKYAFEKAK